MTPFTPPPRTENQNFSTRNRSSLLPKIFGLTLIATSCLLGLLLSAINLIDTPSPHASTTYFSLFTIYFFLSITIGLYLVLKTPLLLSIAYILVFIVFHSGHQLLYFFGDTEFDYFLEGANSNKFSVASWMAALAMSSFGTGVLISMFLSSRENRISRGEVFIKARIAGRALLASSFFSLIILLITVGNIFSYSREQIFLGIGDTRGMGIILMVLPSSLILLTVSSRFLLGRKFMLLISAICFLFFLFMGYRTEALVPALIGLVIWVKCGNKAPITIILVGILIVLIAIPTVRHLRTTGAYSEITEGDLKKSIDQAKISDAFAELGGTTGIIANTISWVPSESPFQWGRTYIRAIKSSLPNIGNEVRISNREKLSNGTSNQEILSTLTPAEWYIYKTNRWKFHAGQGSGFSSVAEAYLNFGTIGVFIIFFLTGALFGYWDRLDITASRWSLVLISTLAWLFVKNIRNDFLNVTKPAIFIFIIVMTWHLLESIMFPKKPFPSKIKHE